MLLVYSVREQSRLEFRIAHDIHFGNSCSNLVLLCHCCFYQKEQLTIISSIKEETRVVLLCWL